MPKYLYKHDLSAADWKMTNKELGVQNLNSKTVKNQSNIFRPKQKCRTWNRLKDYPIGRTSKAI